MKLLIAVIATACTIAALTYNAAARVSAPEHVGAEVPFVAASAAGAVDAGQYVSGWARAPAAVQGHWATILRRLDRRRDAAYRSGSTAALAGVYVPGSQIGLRDRAVLAQYRRRGFVLDGAPIQLLAVTLLRRSARQVVLSVTDRLGPVRVRRAVGRWRSLPHDQATSRVLTLRRYAGGWRIAGDSIDDSG